MLATADRGSADRMAEVGPELEPEPELEPQPARTAKPTRITLQLCQEAIFPDYHIASISDADRLTQQLFETTKLRLNDMAIQQIENLEMFTALQCLYLHHNQIRMIENMEFHPNLRVLSINNNRIEELSGLLCLNRLEYLNASTNKIAHVDEAELPPSLVHLNLSNNPAAWEDDYRQRLIGALPALEDLDAVDVTPAELEAYGCVARCCLGGGGSGRTRHMRKGTELLLRPLVQVRSLRRRRRECC